MRFKPASCVKFSVALAFILFSVIIFVDKETSQDSHRNFTLKTEIVTTTGEHQVSGDLALGDAEDSLSGNRIDGLPNITDSKFDNSHAEPFDDEALLILDHISKANGDQVFRVINYFLLFTMISCSTSIMKICLVQYQMRQL